MSDETETKTTAVQLTPHEAYVLVGYVMDDLDEKDIKVYRWGNGKEVVLEDLAEKLVSVLRADLDEE